jgi:hypothetical protein
MVCSISVRSETPNLASFHALRGQISRSIQQKTRVGEMAGLAGDQPRTGAGKLSSSRIKRKYHIERVCAQPQERRVGYTVFTLKLGYSKCPLNAA